MKKVRVCFVLTLAIALLWVGCAVKRDTSRLAWYPHQPSRLSMTPAGHMRDAGPFLSVDGGFTSDAEIDGAVDAAFSRFGRLFPQFPLGAHPVALNDDYVMWVPAAGTWASGEEVTGRAQINVCLWTRAEGALQPAPGSFIERAPGNYWGVEYANWRWTSRPLAPALEHELLHAAISDPGHTRPEWDTLNSDPRMKAAQDRCAWVSGLDRF